MKTSATFDNITPVLPYDRAVEFFAESGFDGYDVSLIDLARWDRTTYRLKDLPCPFRGEEGLAFARRLRRLGEDCGICCNQTHAPFPVFHAEVYASLCHAIELTAELGAEYCVIHPGNDWDTEKNAEFYRELLPFAKKCGVRIATENMWNRNRATKEVIPAACSSHASFAALLDAVNDPDLVACVDIGHAEMAGLDTSAALMLETLGSRVRCLHVHDNDRIEDDHALPFTGKIDFDVVLRSLKKIGYDGWLTLECTKFPQSFDAETMPECIRRMAQAARSLADRFEKL